MIDTIYQIGKQLSEGRDPWEDILSLVKADTKEGKFNLYELDILFDLDDREISTSLRELSDTYLRMKEVGNMAIRGGNNKAIYPAAPSKKFDQIVKTLFGKAGADEGELQAVIEARYPGLKSTMLYQILPVLYKTKEAFDDTFLDTEKKKYTINKVSEHLELRKVDKIELLVVKVKGNLIGGEEKYLVDVPGYRELLEKEFFSQAESKTRKEPKLDYVIADYQESVGAPKFPVRYNINKYFVQTTRNYASLFNEKAYHKNYQISDETEVFMERGSSYLLEHYRISIAGIQHVIIPTLPRFTQSKLPLDLLPKIHAKSDLIFNFSELDKVRTTVEDEATDDYWINFLAIDSDGNYFKTTNIIKDVPSFHFDSVQKAFLRIGKLFSPWLGSKYIFNLARIYYSIPIKADSNQNEILQLFAAILEKRKIDESRIYSYFTRLILCHWFERYKAFSNIREPKGTISFDLQAKDAVFTFLAFRTALKALNLLTPIRNMQTNEQSPKLQDKIHEDLDNFFNRLGYDPQQQALFHLGQALNVAAYAQERKGNKRAVLNKLNFNGMDRRAIVLLADDLMEKGNQYQSITTKGGNTMNVLARITNHIGQFFSLFPAQEEDWEMEAREALFYILSGYTYHIQSQSSSQA